MFQKLFTAQQIKEIDNQTIIKQNISSEQLMERAANRLFQEMKPFLPKEKNIYIFCGKGNNGGDGLVLARLLYLNNYSVTCFSVPFSPKASPDYQANLSKLKQINFSVEKFHPERPVNINRHDIIIDAIFGTGLSRPATGIAREAINFINQSGATVFSIDVPSGLFVDTSNDKNDSIVRSNIVFSFQFPKISFFYPENKKYVQKYKIVDIGLETEVMESMPTNYYVITGQINRFLKKRNQTAHKYQFGKALIIGGSKSMTGAPIMASKAALRTGAGLVANCIPECGYHLSQIYVPEIITYTCGKNYIDKIRINRNFDAIAVGMGLGTRTKTQKAFKKFIKSQQKPVIIDADALNILSLHPKWLKFIPSNSILTPHTGEFERLAGTWKNDSEKLKKQKDFARKHKVILVLKGAYTGISDGENIYFNPVANSALATAGSGDVLTGIITGLLAQNYAPLKAAVTGVYLHSQSAENYVKKYADFSMIATDIIDELKNFV
jgi:NAD(P)H-hydrate epimerase